jgi:hypothetical protein
MAVGAVGAGGNERLLAASDSDQGAPADCAYCMQCRKTARHAQSAAIRINRGKPSMSDRTPAPPRARHAVIAAAVSLTLSACGGGGAEPAPSSVPATAPAPAPAPAPAARWTPTVGDTWQWQLTGTIDTRYNVTMYDIDLFDAPQSTIDALKAQGRRVVCYFSAGSSENWRADFNRFAAADMGNTLAGWQGERWLDTRSTNVRNIMKARLDLAVSKGCDGVEPDNVDGYTNSPGFSLTAATQLDYNRFLAQEAKARGLAVGLKNDTDQLAALAPDFDFAVNEQCHEFDNGRECDGYSVFTSNGKPVFNAEYKPVYATDAVSRTALCAAARAAGLRTLVLPQALDNSLRFSCD